MAAQPDIQVLTQIVDSFDKVFGTGKGALFPWAMKIGFSLAAIEITFLGLFHALKGGEDNIFVPLIKKILVIGFFIFLVTGVAKNGLADVVLKGFIAVGLKAGGSGVNFSMKAPSGLIEAGFLAADPILDAISKMDTFNFGDKIMAYVCYIVVLVAYAVMAFQVLITYIEFGIVSTLGIILLPFGISKHTAFLSEKAIGAIISFGIKLMVLAFIVAVVQPLLLAIPPLGADPSFKQMLTLAVMVGIIAFIVIQAPGVASAVLSGSPSLSAGVAAGTAFSAAAGAAAPAMLATGAATGGLAAGGMVAGAAAAAGAGNGTFTGNLAKAAAGAIPGAATFGGAKDSAIKAAETGTTGGIKPGSSLNPSGGGTATGGKTETGTTAPGTSTTSTSTNTNTSTGPGTGTSTAQSASSPGSDTSSGGVGGSFQSAARPQRSSLQDAMHQGRQAVPQDASAGGSAGVRIHHDE